MTLLKLDPYINVDPGTMNPFQHGEVFVTDDGAETDLDLGPLRALPGLSLCLTATNNITTGRIYQSRHHHEERRVATTSGSTVPGDSHTSPTRSRIGSASSPTGDRCDVVIVEVGGRSGTSRVCLF